MNENVKEFKAIQYLSIQGNPEGIYTDYSYPNLTEAFCQSTALLIEAKLKVLEKETGIEGKEYVSFIKVTPVTIDNRVHITLDVSYHGYSETKPSNGFDLLAKYSVLYVVIDEHGSVFTNFTESSKELADFVNSVKEGLLALESK
jgi:hypothetical protein